MGRLAWVRVGVGWVFCWAAMVVAACVTAPPPNEVEVSASPGLPSGVAAGDVSQVGAVLWTRSAHRGVITFTVATDDGAPVQTLHTAAVDPLAPVTVTVEGLQSGTPYRYFVTGPGGDRVDGQFRTPAAPGAHRGLRFGVSGDWRGDLAPYPAVANVAQADLDFFVVLGDTIYADFLSPAVPKQALQLEQFRLKHAEVYSATLGLNTLADLRRSTAIYATLDDHELFNDFAGGAQAGPSPYFAENSGFVNDARRFEAALQAFLEYNPLRWEGYDRTRDGALVDERMDGEVRLYRYRTFGSDAALYLLDMRTFRDEPLRPVDFSDPQDGRRFLEEAFTPGRTMLGPRQLADLKADLLDAQARGITWKFIALPDPIQHRGLPAAEDRYEGYAAERAELLRFITEQGIHDVVFITADVHGTLTNNLTYQLGPDSPQLPTDAFEITTGPVAFHAPFGPTVVNAGHGRGELSDADLARYRSLPIRMDADAEEDDKDDFVRGFVDRHLATLGYDPLGLDGSPVDATLRTGDWIAVHWYGWAEFAVDAESKLLTVTVYGIEPYSPRDVVERPAEVLARTPQVLVQFDVHPVAGRE